MTTSVTNLEVSIKAAIREILEERITQSVAAGKSYFFRNVSPVDLHDSLPDEPYFSLKQKCDEMVAKNELVFGSPGYRLFDEGEIAGYRISPNIIPYSSNVFGFIHL